MSIYKTYTPDQLEELNSNFIITSASFSKVDQFSRNEKAFEMSNIYGFRAKSSSTNVSGKAYHEALKAYYKQKKDGIILSLPELHIVAYEFIESFPVNEWKIQKTTPTIDTARKKAIKTVTSLLDNFYKEKSVYDDHISEILDVEIYLTEFITVNGVDIPLPFKMIIDLVVRTHEGLTVIIDHKSKQSFSSEKERVFSMGKQSTVYFKGYESYKNVTIDEVWFCENKFSKNQDETPQLNMFRVILDHDTRVLYEVLLYEPLKRMIEAVSDPDYVYLINDSDNLVDMAELYEFWAKTQISEIGEFDIDESKRELVEKRTRKIRNASIVSINPKVIKQFKANAASFIQYDLNTTDMTKEQKIEHILKTFGISVSVAKTLDGYSSNTYLLEIGAGFKVGSIQKYKLDIANQLNITNVRISDSLTVYEGKSYLAIETSKERDRDLIWDEKELIGMKLPMGKDNVGNTLYWDLDKHSTPHQLVGGATGSGKSVYINSILHYAIKAGLKDIYIFDPKYEFEEMRELGIDVYNDISEIEVVLQLLVEKMEEKKKTKDKSKILIIFDEYAEAMAAAGKKSSIDLNLKRLLQTGRSLGFRVVAATQRASTKVIDGDTKVNFPIQVCFYVPKKIDSKVMIDDEGAETLAGEGDGLVKSPEYPDLVRFQAYFKPQEVPA